MASVLEIISAVGSIAQVVIATVALFLAYKANRLNKDSVFAQRVIQELFDIITMAREVQTSYTQLFNKFGSKKAKVEMRTAWVQKREQVATRIAEIATIFPEVKQTEAAWEELEQVEDTHIFTDALVVTDASACDDAKTRYERVHATFIETVSQLIRKMRQ